MPSWYVAKVKPRNETRVQSYLGRYGVAVYAPQIRVPLRGRPPWEYLFPGYVLVLADPHSPRWPIIRWAWGLNYFLPAHGEPIPLEESVVEAIRRRVEWWNSGGYMEALAFKAGERVQIGQGPLERVEALFQRYLPGKQRCEVLVHLLGRPQRVRLEVEALRVPDLRRRFAQATSQVATF